ncbi:MAG: hypothetical protein LBU66_08380, partial [Treponema sp.]|nr:hypothetical protein [Treponema sp.]
VIVGEAAVTGTGWFNPPFDRGRVVAEPRWPSALEEAQIQRGTSRTPASSLTSEPDKSGKDSLSAIPSAPSTGVEGNIRANETESRQTGQSIAAVPQDMPSSAGAQGSLIPSEQFPLEQAPLEHAQEQALSEQVLFEQTQLEQLPPEVLLQRARESFDGGNVAAAIALLDQVNAHYPSGIDELYWLYGQFYEANSPSRNILLSLDYYRRLVDEFPQSSRFNDARRRIAYLERFYINIQ